MTFTPSFSRTLLLPLVLPARTMLSFPSKDPGDVTDYTLDISAWLAEVGDTVVEWGLTSPSLSLIPLTIAPVPAASQSAQLSAIIGGGSINQEYPLQYVVVTAGGRALERTVWLLVQPITPEIGFGEPLTVAPGIPGPPGAPASPIPMISYALVLG